MFGLDHRLILAAGDEPTARHAADVIGFEVGRGIDRDDAGRFQCGGEVNLAELGVGDRRAHEHAVGLPRHHHVVGVAAEALEEAKIFAALHGGADTIFHDGHLDLHFGGTRGANTSERGGYSAATLTAIDLAAICTALTMLW